MDVLIAGAGPVGLTLALELTRHGVECRIVDKRPQPSGQCKAIGIQPRTLEIWDAMGLLHDAVEAGIWLRGQLVFRDKTLIGRMELGASDLPYGFLGLPQYETERILLEHLAARGVAVDRPVELQSFDRDGDGVTAQLAAPSGAQEARCRYLVGCDGAHSTVRRGLGLSFEGGRFAEQYMLGDVEADWDLPRGYGLRFLSSDSPDLLVCIPLPGRRRYRMSALAPPELRTPADATGEADHGILTDRPAPGLAHLQAVADRLGPGAALTSLRWSSLFAISHRIVDCYGRDRVFVVGDAAHIHPPTGAQGMNTGIQDAWNLAWKLVLAIKEKAAPGLLDSYDLERRPVGEEVVGRTVRHAHTQYQHESEDPDTALRREAQLLVNYRGSPIVAERTCSAAAIGPQPGDRAPDAYGLVARGIGHPIRLHELLRHPAQALVLYADKASSSREIEALDALADRILDRHGGLVRPHLVLAPESADVELIRLPVVRDEQGAFRAAYGARGSAAWVVRPDQYVGLRCEPIDEDAIERHLASTLA